MEKYYRILLRDNCEVFIKGKIKFQFPDYIEIDGELILNKNGIPKKYKNGIIFCYNIIGIFEEMVK